ncbi:methyltransferase [Cellulomonas chitinilytica]|uniref:Methyltransferase n=1 Tax=Cellulomonas chitinilytica TaxID=398759 RepID=A0A919NZA6_9CELL|nr:class I SAM-dependent methyltransferase [Cellulomonas chitinilytica]GIG20307.1 methyltransferase [Cellulomonas chitinilytica]
MASQHDVRLLDPLAHDATPEPYLPAAGKPWLLPLYDPMTRLGGVRRRHARLVALSGIAAGDRVLDLGCGTGNLALLVAASVPGSVVTGVDPDRPSLERAARKARRRRLPMTLVRGYGQSLPLPDESVDHVVSALALHHVAPDARAATAGEILRVLRPGGTVTVADFSAPDEHGRQGGHGHRLRRRHDHNAGHALADGNRDGGIVQLLTGAGLGGAIVLEHDRLAGSSLTYVQARRA